MKALSLKELAYRWLTKWFEENFHTVREVLNYYNESSDGLLYPIDVERVSNQWYEFLSHRVDHQLEYVTFVVDGENVQINTHSTWLGVFSYLEQAGRLKEVLEPLLVHLKEELVKVQVHFRTQVEKAIHELEKRRLRAEEIIVPLGWRDVLGMARTYGRTLYRGMDLRFTNGVSPRVESAHCYGQFHPIEGIE